MSKPLWPRTVACQAPLSSTLSPNFLSFMPIEPLMLFNHRILCQCLLLLPSVFLSISVFPNKSPLHSRWLQLQHQLNIQGWFPLGSTGFIFLLSKGLSGVFSSTTIWKHQFFSAQPSLWFNSHICTWLLEKLLLWLYGLLLTKWCLCFFNMLSRFFIVLLPRSEHLLISWL